MPLDHTIFLQGAALAQRDREAMLENLARGIDSGIKMKALKAEKGLDLEKLASGALIKMNMGEQLTPQEMATLKAFDTMNTSKLMRDPTTGEYGKANASILGGFDMGAFSPQNIGPQGQGSNPAISLPYDEIQPIPMDLGAVEKALEGTPVDKQTFDTSKFNQPSLGTAPSGLNPAAKQKFDEAYLSKRAEKAAEKEAEMPKKENKLLDAASRMKSVDSEITRAIKLVKPTTAGFGSNLKDIPLIGKGTDSYDLDAVLKTIKADAAFSELQNMRDNSPTGGALGSIAVPELELLQSAAASLDQGQSPEVLAKNLRKYQETRRGVLKRVGDAFEKDYGYRPDFEKLGETKPGAVDWQEYFR